MTSTVTSKPQNRQFAASDGLELAYYVWQAAEPTASLIISHGYAEHAGRYADFAGYLTSQGVSVYALDHRGHGHSGGERANVDVFRSFVTDLARFCDLVRELNVEHPRIVLGHSMGGVIAAQMVLEHPFKLDGLILSAPFLKNAIPVPALLDALAGPVARLIPSLPTLKLDTSKLSRDKEVVKAYEADPLVYTGGVKARLGHEMTSAGEYVLERASSISLPLLVLHGSADAIADPAGSQELCEAATSEDKTMKLYNGFYHEILNELDKEAVYADVLTWLKARRDA